MEPLDYQRDAVAIITGRVRAFMAGHWRGLVIQPRWHSLMVGPSGTGKTAVAAMVAEAVGATMLRVSAPSWMPSGAHNRSTRETIAILAEHVARNDQTILVVDELDKISDTETPWLGYVRNELFDVMGGVWPTGLNLPEIEDAPDITIEVLTQKLRESMFVLAIGTFQSWFDDATARRTIGFGAAYNPEKDEITAEIVAQRLPRELANRFHSSIIRLPELTPADYHRIARDVETKLPERMRNMFRTEAAKRIPGAIAAKKGARFLEETMTEVLMHLPPEPNPPNPTTIEATPDIDLCTL